MPLFRSLALGLLALAAVAVAGESRAQDQPSPTLIDQFGDWELYVYGEGDRRICFVLSRPERLEPPERDHGDVFFFLTSRPAEGIASEASVIVGYEFAPDSTVGLDIDGQEFTMFVDKDGAWLEQPADEQRVLAAMRAGRSLVVTGRSSRGTNTRYTFSLSGVTASTNAMRQQCG